MLQPIKMSANLVGAAGFKRDIQKRVVLETSKNLKVRMRLFSAFISARLYKRPHFHFVERKRDIALIFDDAPIAERSVSLNNAPFQKFVFYMIEKFLRPANKHQPRYIAIQPMNDTRPQSWIIADAYVFRVLCAKE